MATDIDMIAGSEICDSQGEVLSISGCDISELEAGRGYFNDNHSSKLVDMVGRITYAKKIFKSSDCEDDRQRYYYNKVKAPYLYVKGSLFDSEGDHRAAKAAAAILRHQHKDDSPLKLKSSVEGGVIERGEKDEKLLKRTKIKAVALTFVPANNATLVEGINLSKSATPKEDEALIKSLVPYAQTNVPSFIDIADRMSEQKIVTNLTQIKELLSCLNPESLTKSQDIIGKTYGAMTAAGHKQISDSNGIQTFAKDGKVTSVDHRNKTYSSPIKLKHLDDAGYKATLNKALTAGYGGGSPTDTTGGQVLQTESLEGGRGFKEITCPKCGKEQPHTKYQVRCRKCDAAFPFDTLADAFLKKSLSGAWYAKVKGESKYHKVNKVLDNKLPLESGGGNMYHLHDKPEPVHAKNIADIKFSGELEDHEKVG